jgi:S-adenosylmethionine hydrolase
MSASFHGRDLFASVAALLARGEIPDAESVSHFPERRSTESLLVREGITDAESAELSAPADAPWPDDLAEIIHIDHYGNAITGLRFATVTSSLSLRVGVEVLKYARIFSEVPRGKAFWYENANGLVEIAVNAGSAAALLGLKPGDPLTFIQP